MMQLTYRGQAYELNPHLVETLIIDKNSTQAILEIAPRNTSKNILKRQLVARWTLDKNDRLFCKWISE